MVTFTTGFKLLAIVQQKTHRQHLRTSKGKARAGSASQKQVTNSKCGESTFSTYYSLG